MNLNVQIQLRGQFFNRRSAELRLNEDGLGVFPAQLADQFDKLFRFGSLPPRLDRPLAPAELGAVITVGGMEDIENRIRPMTRKRP